MGLGALAVERCVGECYALLSSAIGNRNRVYEPGIITGQLIEEWDWAIFLPCIVMPRGTMDGRLPTTHARRIQLRDAKMWRRESDRPGASSSSKSNCPCSLCLFGRPLLRSTQARHLRDYGRHPIKRLQPQVSSILLHNVLFSSVCYAFSDAWTMCKCATVSYRVTQRS